jgi:hypothetical protein
MFFQFRISQVLHFYFHSSPIYLLSLVLLLLLIISQYLMRKQSILLAGEHISLSLFFLTKFINNKHILNHSSLHSSLAVSSIFLSSYILPSFSVFLFLKLNFASLFPFWRCASMFLCTVTLGVSHLLHKYCSLLPNQARALQPFFIDGHLRNKAPRLSAWFAV